MNLPQNDQQLLQELNSIAQQNGIILRLVGGYVRDLILGNDSHDLDLVVDKGSGLEFANKVVASMGGKVHTIQENPSQSKHLETAVVYIDGREVQFCGFRKEIYNQESRIPSIETGTIIEDAHRRDATINALYYNLTTNQVEDPTQKGLHDLQHKIIRTPLPPTQTFLDDPLRLVRVIRFATRFGFTIDPEILQATKNSEIQNALKTKVSRERIEIEMRKIMSGINPHQAIRLLSDFGILYIVFQFPADYVDWDLDQKTPHHQLSVFNHTLEALKNLQPLMKKFEVKEEDKFLLNYAILLHDAGKLNPIVWGEKSKDGITKRTYYNHEKYSLEATEHILKQLHGTKQKEIERIKKLILGSSHTNPNYTPDTELCSVKRKVLCKFVKLCREDTKNAVVVNMADTSAKKKNSLDSFSFAYHISMLNQINEIGIENILNLKPLLNGDEVYGLIGGSKDKRISQALNKLLEYQFSNPTADKEKAVKFIKGMSFGK